MNISVGISIFKSCMDATPVNTICVEDFCGAVMGNEFQNEVEALRRLSEKKERDAVKKTLPAVTVSGTFTHRAEKNLVQHSGFICVDFDAKENPQVNDWQTLRDTLGGIEEVLFSSLSVSGRGVFCIIPISYPERHKQQFDALVMDFRKIGLNVDTSGRDISRLRVISYDPLACWNPDAKSYQRIFEQKPTMHTHKANVQNPPDLEKLAQWTQRKYGIFTKGNRNRFITQLAAAAHRMGKTQAEVEAYCRQYATMDFSENSIVNTIKSIYSNSSWSARAV